MEPFVNVAVQAARLAGDYIRRQQDQAPFLEVNHSPNHGESTLVDLHAEQLIIQAIRKKFPKHNILSEEEGSIDQGSDVTWIIDPLDGTRNFIHSISHFAVAIAIEIKGQLEHAVILDPIRHECFTASRGRGAQMNNRRLRVSQKFLNLNTCLIGYGKHHQLEQRSPHIQNFIQAGLKHSSLRRMGSTSLDLAYVASGRLDAYFGLDLKPWDCAAGSLLIQEAGGVITNFLGKPHQKQDSDLVTGHFKLVKTLVESWNKDS